MPVGAATELEGPVGDRFLTVITPGSPAGRASISRGAGEVTIRGEPYEWEIFDVG